MIIDSHQHFWDPARATYSWMTDDLASIRRRFQLADLEPLVAACNVSHTIAVQARAHVDETTDLLAIGSQSELVAGVIGWVDLTAANVEETLAELRSMPGGEKLVGIRHQVHDEPDPSWLLRDDVQRGLAAVGASDLVFDLLVRSRELAAAFETAKLHPSITFVLDHLAKPPIFGSADRGWALGVERLSTLPNVAVKLSGLVTEADWQRWTLAQLEPFVSRAFDWFGADRVLFGSDWPVCTLAASYEDIFLAYRDLARNVDPGGVDRVLGSNAERIYRL